MDHQKAHRQLFVFAQNTFVLARRKGIVKDRRSKKVAGNHFFAFVCLLVNLLFG